LVDRTGLICVAVWNFSFWRFVFVLCFGW